MSKITNNIFNNAIIELSHNKKLNSIKNDEFIVIKDVKIIGTEYNTTRGLFSIIIEDFSCPNNISLLMLKTTFNLNMTLEEKFSPEIFDLKAHLFLLEHFVKSVETSFINKTFNIFIFKDYFPYIYTIYTPIEDIINCYYANNIIKYLKKIVSY